MEDTSQSTLHQNHGTSHGKAWMKLKPKRPVLLWRFFQLQHKTTHNGKWLPWLLLTAPIHYPVSAGFSWALGSSWIVPLLNKGLGVPVLSQKECAELRDCTVADSGRLQITHCKTVRGGFNVKKWKDYVADSCMSNAAAWNVLASFVVWHLGLLLSVGINVWSWHHRFLELPVAPWLVIPRRPGRRRRRSSAQFSEVGGKSYAQFVCWGNSQRQVACRDGKAQSTYWRGWDLNLGHTVGRPGQYCHTNLGAVSWSCWAEKKLIWRILRLSNFFFRAPAKPSTHSFWLVTCLCWAKQPLKITC